MSQLSLNNLDKSNWQKLPFGEIAQSISERVEPTNTNLETYVGLEHIDPESIHIKRFGKREDVSGTKLRCYPGDVIFGRRRAYQRKAAICEFDGFCSAHSLVLRAIPEVIDPKLFPFFLHSDQFMHRAVDISVGGLSPTINWTKLKKEEFLLPPKDQQAKLAELLWAADTVVEKTLKTRRRAESTYDNLLTNLFKDKDKEKFNQTKVTRIAKVNADSLKGKTAPDFKFEYLDIASIVGPKQIGPLETISFKDAPSRARRIVPNNSIILSMVRPYLKAFAYVDVGDGKIASTGTAVVTVDEAHNSQLVYHQFFSKRFQLFCEGRMTGTNYPAITSKDVEDFKVYLPESREEEDLIAQQLDAFDQGVSDLQKRIKSSKLLLKSLINEIFSQPA